MNIQGPYYAGIGSRDTPEPILAMMQDIARRLGLLGYTLRSGGADGADEAFRVGSMGHPQEIFTPWRGFIKDPEADKKSIVVTEQLCYPQALEMAGQFHPNWPACSQGARKLHARNMMQVMGRDLNTRSEFVVCWTKDGKASGGTGQALRLAAAVNIPVFNLHSKRDCDYIMRQLASMEQMIG